MSLWSSLRAKQGKPALSTPNTPKVKQVRRIVTENDGQGRSFVVHEGGADPVLESLPGAGLFEIWADPGGTSLETLPGPVSLLPPQGGVKCRWFTVLPVPPGVTAAQLAAFYDGAFAAMSSHNIRPDTARHPGMHRTQTLDFIIVIEGQVKLILDKEERLLGPGDVVVQRATNHAWSCVSETPALLVAVLIDKTAAFATE